MEPENNLQKNIGIFLSVVVGLGVLFVTIFLGKQSTTTLPPAPLLNQGGDESGNSNSPAPVASVSQNPPADIPKKSVSAYKDGTYSATGSYLSPGGYDQLGVSITLKNGIITNASVTNMASDGRSQRYQNNFISAYKQYVLGKNIGTLSLTKISGSSLTPKGFNDALAQIKSQAQA